MIPLLLILAAGPDPSGMLALISPFGIARGCPIGETTVLTSRHIAVTERPSGPPNQGAMLWSDGFGESGIAWTQDYDLRRDLAVLQTDRPVSHVYLRADRAPLIGEFVVIAGFKFNDRFQLRTIRTKVLNVVALHLVLEDGAEQGFSGSCVLNEKNEVVGVFQWSVERGSSRRGVASGVWGEWADVGWMPPR